MYFSRLFNNRDRFVLQSETDSRRSKPISSTRVSDQQALVILQQASIVAASIEEGEEFSLVLEVVHKEVLPGSLPLTVSLIEQAPHYGLLSTYILDTEVGFKKISPAPAG